MPTAPQYLTKGQILAGDPNANFGPSIQGGYFDEQSGRWVNGTNYEVGDWMPKFDQQAMNTSMKSYMDAGKKGEWDRVPTELIPDVQRLIAGDPLYQQAQNYDQSLFKEFITVPAMFAAMIATAGAASAAMGGAAAMGAGGIGAGAAATPGLGAGALGLSGGATGAGIYGGLSAGLGSSLGAGALGGSGLVDGLGAASYEGAGGALGGLGDAIGIDPSSTQFAGGGSPWGGLMGDAAVPGDAYMPGGLASGGGANPVPGDAFLPGALAPGNGLGTVAGNPLSSASWMDLIRSGYNPMTGNSLSLGNIPGGQSLVQQLLGGKGGVNDMGLLGGLLGALAGGIGANQKPAGTTTTVQDIPDYLKPYQSMNLTSGVNNFGLASQGSALLPGAMDQMARTIAGQYLDPNTNPAFQPYAKDLMGNALSTFNGQYGGAAGGGINNSGFQEGAARAITNAALPLYNSAYQTERGNQINAAGQAPAFASNYAGAALAPNLAFKNLYSGPQATTTPYFTNPGAGIFSGGLAGLTLGNAFGKS